VKDKDKTKEQLINELEKMRQGITKSEASEAEDKRAEQELDLFFRALIEDALDVIVILDAGGTIRYLSPAVESVLGYKPEELVGKDMSVTVWPDDLANLMNAFAKVINNPGVPLKLELNLKHKDGSIRVIEAIGKNLLNNPKVAGIVANFRDITERKQAEEALKESHEKFQMVASNITVAAWSADIGEDGAFENTYTSTVFDELLGLPVGTLKNDWNKYFSYVKPEYMERINIAFGKAIESPGTIMECECEVVKDNGQTAWLYSSGRCFENNGKLRVFGSTEDITERKIIEQDLRKSEQRFREVSDNALAWVWEIDVDGKYTYSSSTC